jgi:16S rRNA (cytosine967-C5)-methyltransferase
MSRIGIETRALAWDALCRIDHDGAYANLIVPKLLADVKMDTRDRGLVTELVYGTTRMRRACDHLIDRFVMRDPDPEIRSLLRLGAYQLAFADVKPHAAVAATVEVAPKAVRGFVNAILRRVADAPVEFPDTATELSYPDWIVKRLRAELGDEDAYEAMVKMNQAPTVHERDDGYRQDLGSQWVADLVGAKVGERVIDLCAAPGGKISRMASFGADAIGADLQLHRARLMHYNVRNTIGGAKVVVSDGRAAPFADATFDRVLVDAPCSGLGALRRRPDARWRIQESDIGNLATLQRELLNEAWRLVRPGGVVVWSVCTVTAAESIDHDDPSWTALPAPEAPWQPFGRGGRLMPHDADTDAMTIIRWQA